MHWDADATWVVFIAAGLLAGIFGVLLETRGSLVMLIDLQS